MPVCLDRVSYSNLLKHEQVLYGQSTARSRQPEMTCIDIGIVNNMTDAALPSTEHQFLKLLDSAAGDVSVNVTFYSLPDVPRSDRAWRHINSFYAKIEDLWDRRLDGLIVTGAEPKTARLRDEPYWASLAGLLEWADQNTYSSIWSCLAAHAAVLHMDGIQRCRLIDKRFGLFQCDHASDHPLSAGLPSRVVMPHSRWNDLPEKELLQCGYEILTRSKDAGVDAFVKQRNSLFVLFQGHPEYEANTLLLEYRRDVGRYLRGEKETYPSMPQNCIDPSSVRLLEELQARMVRNRSERLLADFPLDLVARNLEHEWRSPAAHLYRNWLMYLAATKARKAADPVKMSILVAARAS